MTTQFENMVGGFQKISRSTPRRSEQEMPRNKKDENKNRQRDNKRTIRS